MRLALRQHRILHQDAGDAAPAGNREFLERLDRHAGLLRADVLHVEAEDAGELGEVVGVAAGLDQ